MANKQIKDLVEKTIVDQSDQFLLQDVNGITKKMSMNTILNGPNIVHIRKLDDFPTPVTGVITLEEKDYIIEGEIDLLGNRLVASGICSILGITSETSKLKSTGLSAGLAMITTAYTMPIRNITFYKPTGVLFDINSGGAGAYDWLAVNFDQVRTIGTIQNFSNLIIDSCAFFDAGGLILSGAFDTVSFNSSIFSTFGTGIVPWNYIIKTDATVNRRIRATFCAIVTDKYFMEVLGDIPVDQFIMFRCNFSGNSPTDYFNFITAGDNRSDWEGNKGIANSRTNGKLFMNGNSTATTFSATSTYTKVLGTTTENSLNQRFEHTNNRLEYSGSITKIFTLTAIASISGGNNKDLDLVFVKNGGIVLSASSAKVTTDAGGKVTNMSISDVIELSYGDYVEVWMANDTDTTAATVVNLSFTIRT